MKYLLVAGFLYVAFWLWRNNREAEKRDAAPRPPRATNHAPRIAATEIVACDVCDVHLPRHEAVTSAKGIFCSDAHRQQADGG